MKSNTKDWIQYSTAIAMVASGIVLAFMSFLLTENHDVNNGVLLYVGQALAFAGAVFGISLYVKTKVGEVRNEALDEVKEMVRRWAHSQSEETRKRASEMTEEDGAVYDHI